MERKNISSGAPWEDIVGYSRAVRIRNTIEVSGTAPVKDGKVQGETAYEQTIACLEIIKSSLEEAGGRLEDVVRTRIFVTDISQWEEFAKAHAKYFGQIKPATSMVEISRLIDRKMLVEIEATAVVSGQ
ncbi:MAG: RidA family protein [Cytophagales bacterium]|nr:RidA family protein [Cytophagales bacterium]